MATLKIWNIEDEIVLEDEGPWDALEDVLESFKQEHNVCPSGGLNYDIKIDTDDTCLMQRDDLEYDSGSVVGRYEIKV